MKLYIISDDVKNIRLDVMIFVFPISSDKGNHFRIIDETTHLISKRWTRRNIINLSEKTVFLYNTMQLSHANRLMFGNKYSLEILREINKSHYFENR